VIPGFDLLKGLAVGLLIGTLLGFTTGWRVHSWKDASDQQAVIVKVMRDDAESQKNSAEIDDRVDAKSTVIQDGRRKAVQDLGKHLQPITPAQLALTPNPTVTHECLKSDIAPFLPAGAVGVLNRALDPRSPDPAVWSDAQSKAVTGVGMFELSVKLIDVAAEYYDLAQRHDELVDWVAGEVKKRQQRRQ
jgi:hypothetical protein